MEWYIDWEKKYVHEPKGREEIERAVSNIISFLPRFAKVSANFSRTFKKCVTLRVWLDAELFKEYYVDTYHEGDHVVFIIENYDDKLIGFIVIKGIRSTTMKEWKKVSKLLEDPIKKHIEYKEKLNKAISGD